MMILHKETLECTPTNGSTKYIGTVSVTTTLPVVPLVHVVLPLVISVLISKILVMVMIDKIIM